jgi:hypothetical protein
LAQRDIQFPVQKPFMGFLDMDGLPGSKHGLDSITIRLHSNEAPLANSRQRGVEGVCCFGYFPSTVLIWPTLP